MSLGGTLAAPEMMYFSSPPRKGLPYIFTNPIIISQMPGTATMQVGLICGSLVIVCFTSPADTHSAPVKSTDRVPRMRPNTWLSGSTWA